jgi:AmiR/NasT family two-component response regulator
MNVLVAIHDLMFSSKVTAALRGSSPSDAQKTSPSDAQKTSPSDAQKTSPGEAQRRQVNWLPRGSKVIDHVAATKPDVLLIDLASPALDSVNAIRAIKAGEQKGTVVIGYVDHTRADLMEAARAAGCDQVLSKGEFARRLPELLQGL